MIRINWDSFILSKHFITLVKIDLILRWLYLFIGRENNFSRYAQNLAYSEACKFYLIIFFGNYYCTTLFFSQYIVTHLLSLKTNKQLFSISCIIEQVIESEIRK